tara:strand:+ start:1803 stop:2024 length:222 start_codon:yes stop_codon:yes gene_type:complete
MVIAVKGIKMINCPKCKDIKMIWGGDHDNDDENDKQYLIMSNFSCPNCKTIVYVNWSEKDGKRKERNKKMDGT